MSSRCAPLRRELTRAAAAWLVVFGAAPAFAQAPVAYTIRIPEPQHHWMQVEALFPDLPTGAAQLVMSRTSPGRYAIHEFAKNVYDVAIEDGAGRQLRAEHPAANVWEVGGHAGTIHVRYRVFGDLTDGTYLGIDTSHAHINIPA